LAFDFFRIKTGLAIEDGINIFHGITDPVTTSTGITAPKGSLYAQIPVTGEPQVWKKWGSADNEWKKLQTKSFITSTGIPDNTNDEIDTASIGNTFEIGDIWITTSTGKFYICVDNTTNNAIWNGGTDNHLHDNLSNLNSINQNLSTIDFPTFAGLTIGTSTGIVKTSSGIVTVHTKIDHNTETDNIQGGSAYERYHLTSTGYTIATQEASISQHGYLTSSGYNLFNNKQDALTFGDLTTSTGLSIDNGTNAVIGADVRLGIADGYYLPTDWDEINWNNKQNLLNPGNITSSTGLTIVGGTGASVTSTGLTINIASGYHLPTTSEKNNWDSKENAITAGSTSQYWRGDKSFQTLDKTAVGLSSVTNDAQVKKISSSVIDNIVSWNSSTGDIPKDSGISTSSISSTISNSHSPFILGTKTINEDAIGDGKLVAYNTSTGQLVYVVDKNSGDMLKSIYDTNDDGIVDFATSTGYAVNSGNADTVDGKHSYEFSSTGHLHDDRYYTETEVDAKFTSTGLTFGNLTTSTGLIISNGTGVVIGTGTSIKIDSGFYLPTTADKSTWNNAIQSSEKGSPYGVATLSSSGLIPVTQLPSLVITDTFVVGSESAMLNLTTAEKGDIAIRTDVNKTFILANSPYSILSNWKEVITPDTSDKRYIVQTTDPKLPNAQALDMLTTGILKNTTSTGVVSIAVAGLDYLLPNGDGSGLTNIFPNQTGQDGKYLITSSGTTHWYAPTIGNLETSTGLTVIGGLNAVFGNGATIGVASGYHLPTNGEVSTWDTVTGKENILTKGNLTTSTGLSVTGGTSAVIGSGVNIKIDSGYYLPTTSDESNWNAKENSLTKGNLTTSTGLVVSGGTGAVIGSGASIKPDSGYFIPTTVEKSNWDSAFDDSHIHSNTSNLNSINQNLGTSDSPSFNGLTIGTSTGIVKTSSGIIFVYPTISHNNETDVSQGGNSTERYHLTNAEHTIATQAASLSQAGYLTSSGYATFNNKQNSLSFGNLTTSTGLSIIGGTGAVIGSGVSVDIVESNITHNNLGSKQGGISGEYFHLTSTGYNNSHSPYILGTKTINEDAIADGYAIVYNTSTGQLIYGQVATTGVDLTTNQSIGGIKTFTSFPVTPSSAPTSNYQVANKKYVDDNMGGGSVETLSPFLLCGA
jgi:hypothetical protein